MEPKSNPITVRDEAVDPVGADLDRKEWLRRFMTSTPEEVKAFDEILRAQRAVDDKLWR